MHRKVYEELDNKGSVTITLNEADLPLFKNRLAQYKYKRQTELAELIYPRPVPKRYLHYQVLETEGDLVTIKITLNGERLHQPITVQLIHGTKGD